MKRIRTIAIHLPQFHPVPENDLWWGKGFTEWTNVVKAKPLFDDHYQPHLPADLGFYDLRLHEARQAQADMAAEYGIDGFCYYHYWFNGRRILERPVDEILKSGKPEFPFMLCWANENWTRTWDGSESKVLLEQKYSQEDDIEHILHLIPYLKDPRYIKIDNKPVLAIYRSAVLPDPKATVRTWREVAAQHGLELYICRFESFAASGASLIEDNGFDAAVGFEPFSAVMKKYTTQKMNEYKKRLFLRVRNKIRNSISRVLFPTLFKKYAAIDSMVNYEEYVDFLIRQPAVDYKLFPGITPMWDNSARKKSGYFMFNKASPAYYEKWLSWIFKNFKPYSKEENLVFINAWNEWAEGSHLEPCAKWGKQYLEATARVVKENVNLKG
jgi:lipopolysaccharide biosynthesis protein